LCDDSLSVVTFAFFFPLGQGHLLSHIEQDETYIKRLCFSNKSTFYVCGTVNRHNCHSWGSESPHDVTEHKHDPLKVNVWCTLMRHKVISPFFF